MTAPLKRRSVTIPDLQAKKEAGKPISAVGVFDWNTAAIADRVGIDLLIIGDAGGICMMGAKNMNAIEPDEMFYMTRAVARGAQYGLVVTDMPYMTYHFSAEDGIRNAARYISQGGARAVKCEGNARIAEKFVKPITDTGIPVIGHIGVEGFRISAYGVGVQGKTAARAKELIADANAMVEAGCFAVLCELMTPEVVSYLRRTLPVPVISLGSGTDTDGTYIISSDMFKICGSRTPRSAKMYADVASVLEKGFRDYVDDIENKRYPGPEHSTSMPDEERDLLYKELGFQP